MNRIPGITLRREADGHLVIRLPGTTTFMGDQEPLLVVNGVPLGPNENGNVLAINPNDVESIVVLRDPANTSFYGSRGANGVIVIRTKRS